MAGASRTGRAAISGYLGFVAALMLVLIPADQAVPNSFMIIGLLATSLPAFTAWPYVESIDWEGFEQAHRPVRRMVNAVAVTLSLAGFLFMLWNFSRLAVFLVILQIGVWYLLIEGMFYLGDEES